jgi:hypothetical protein
MNSQHYNQLFDEVIKHYHVLNSVAQPYKNPYQLDSFEHLLHRKCWIDTVQWHLEDLIRLPNIDPIKAIGLKRKIDASNQDRTDMVEYVDGFFLKKHENVVTKLGAKINTETPAWAIDRLSILALKIYHMREESLRETASEEHRVKCAKKLSTLLEQRNDLSSAIDDLLSDIATGEKYMKVYKQMKMYNDESMNPVLYAQKNQS